MAKDLSRVPTVEEIEHVIQRYMGDNINPAHKQIVAEAVLRLITTPADDPSKDPVGTIRAQDDERAVKVLSDAWVIVGQSVWFAVDEVKGWPVIGTVPGTPAAAKDELGKRKASSNEPNWPEQYNLEIDNIQKKEYRLGYNRAVQDCIDAWNAENNA